MSAYVQLIINTLNEMGQLEDKPELMNANEKTKLLGGSGILDSLGVVFLISELEDQLVDMGHDEVVLADEKAMSQSTSPFRNVESLANYINKLIQE